MRWDTMHTQKGLTISEDGLTLSWDDNCPGEFQPCWLGAQTTARLERRLFAWDFVIDCIADRQIGVGILVAPPDWGFFGYLGAGRNAWAYDAYEGAIVTETKAIHSGLPTIKARGVVAVRLDLRVPCACSFVVDGRETPLIPLPEGAVVIPAACLLKRGQRVTLRGFQVQD